MESKEIEIRDLFQYGTDHLISALLLFDHPMLQYPQDSKIHITYDSAVYLAHLGIEQIIKACVLSEGKEFAFEHNILSLIKKVDFVNKALTSDTLNLIDKLKHFEFARYPRNSKFSGIEVGDEDREKILELHYFILDSMPDDLYNIYETVGVPKDYILKGDRILMKKKNSDPSS